MMSWSLSHNAVTVTQSHDHVSQEKVIERSKRNGVTIIYLIYVNLKENIWPLG